MTSIRGPLMVAVGARSHPNGYEVKLAQRRTSAATKAAIAKMRTTANRISQS